MKTKLIETNSDFFPSHLLYIFYLSILLGILSCAKPNKGNNADTIYINGDILTMAGDKADYVEAVALKDGKILFTGNRGEAMNLKGDSTQVIDLKGQTLMPGFIDAHGHVSLYAQLSSAVNLLPEPYGTVMSIADLQKAIKDFIIQNKIPPGMPVMGNGYDDAIMQEHRHPTAQELDVISTVNPIYILHTSGHMGVANSLLLKNMGITYDTPDPEGGVIGRDPKTHQLTGKMIENANVNSMLYVVKQLPQPSGDDVFKSLLAAEKEWFANGQTTICDGRPDPGSIKLVFGANNKNLLKGDYIILPDYDTNKDSLTSYKKYYKTYHNRVKIGAIKMTFDGSPQGKSAWLTQPYLVPPDGESADFKGQPIYTHEAAYNGLKDIFSHGMQAHVHCNGDAAIDEGLNLMERLKKEGLLTSDMRCVLVHSQVCRKDQVSRFKEIGIMPSWFPTHCYLWGDWHMNSVLGKDRASHISPLKEGLDQGVRFTIHHDSPVTPPDLLTAIYAAVNRKTRSGFILGPEQRVSPYEALKAITMNAAWQWGEENEKGSIEKGKKADLVILDKNPVKVDPLTIKDIKVMETFKEGKSVFKR
ncbi:amidohydrolase [Chryseobacterium potabilaquae]|uniref:N-substituted formamide deformylase n=1 Tax=Chryseobacterium potabilaquae TaxID=2675057 RepID=A0A6N4X7R8_9FLAO|nr:amidohydrolase [Chryseobacterium potabilaquae]CAA7197143.1 N-substituted formamide deformylase [Chryseobacterium potabilaquae]